MASSPEGPNPLRPYYVPPTVGPPPSKSNANGTSASSARSGAKAAPSSRPGYGASTRDMLSDLDYSDYLSDGSPSVVEMIKTLVDQGLWKYTSVLFAQPFEVAKTVLQAQDAGAVEEKGKGREIVQRSQSHQSAGQGRYDIPSDDESDTDSQSYFTSSAPLPSSRKPRRRFSSSRSPSPTPSRSSRPSRRRSPQPPGTPSLKKLPSTSSITTALSTLWTNEGAWGVWKGTNSTFVHSILLSTLTTFLRSLLCAIVGLPDPGLPLAPSSSLPGPSSLTGIDILSSPAPVMALFAAVSASGLAGILLAPIDIARTKLMLTPATMPPRSIIPTLRALRSWLLPAAIAPVTFLHSTLPTLISASTPLFLRSNLGIDPDLTPTTYAIATFASQVFELGIRLPIETVLRRGQIATVRGPTGSPNTRGPKEADTRPQEPLQTIVDAGPYKGLFGTMYHIVFEEGSKAESPAEEGIARATGTAAVVRPQAGGRRRKGQGLEGLWRGWRVGVWGLIGCWGASALGGGKGGEF
ncbi:MAG: mitochondrial fusion and transport protein ugo1 [Stictis urceolatum]|nr:mitochondrial fusion and transport protein ugo1 [Stictis urceolata]